MVYEVLPRLPYIQISGPKSVRGLNQRSTSPSFENKAWTGRYVGHTDGDFMCLNLNKSQSSAFHLGCTDVRECLTSTADSMSSIPDPLLDDGVFADYFV